MNDEELKALVVKVSVTILVMLALFMFTWRVV